VNNNGENVLHYVGDNGQVRHLEKFDQQTINVDRWKRQIEQRNIIAYCSTFQQT